MPSTRPTTRRQASPTATKSRIPVPKAPKLPATVRRPSPRRREMVAPVAHVKSTRVLRPRPSLTRTPTGANKENYPLVPRPGFLSRANPISPSRMKGNGAKRKPFGKSTRVVRNKRVPLRELTEAEVFERDEAVIGDLRRRRASGENYVVDGLGEAIVIEIKSVLAHEPDPEGPSPSGDDVSKEVPFTAPVAKRTKPERVTVLRRSDSQERSQANVESIVASSSLAVVIDCTKRPRTRGALALKKQHPAVRNSLDSIENHSPDGYRSAETTPIKLFHRATREASPLSAAKHYAGITKAQVPQSPLKINRIGLGAKSANTVMKLFQEEGVQIGEKGKMVLERNTTKTVTRKMTTATKLTATKETKVAAHKAKSSLKRAAGVVGSNSARAGLAGIGRVR